MRKFEYDIIVSIRKAKKLKWMLNNQEENLKKDELLKRVKVGFWVIKEELNKQSDQDKANKNFEKLKEILQPYKSFKKSDIPDYFICSLTQSLMVEPVINEFGNSYEKKVYISHALSKKTDPISGHPLDKNVLYDNISLRSAIEHYLEE
jgi:STIP1 family protein 1